MRRGGDVTARWRRAIRCRPARGCGEQSLARTAAAMSGRLRASAALTAGLLAVAACGSPPSGGPRRPAGRQVTRAWLEAVTATSGGDAWAVGSFRHAHDDLPLIEHWDGRRWTWARPGRGLQTYADYVLAGVAATSAANVLAAGWIASQYVFPLIDRWDGAAWKQVPTPAAGCCVSAASLSGVAAASRTNAWAVGEKTVGSAGERTLILRWNARAGIWVKVPSPNPAGRGGAARSALTGVAVRTVTDAWAVGAARSGPSGQRNTLIEHWDGTSWTVVPSPDPSRGGCVSDGLSGVAATPAATWAVGDYCGAALALRLTGGRWQQMPAPGPPAGTSERLASVAVTSAADAWAAGSIGRRILILHWNGTRWATAHAPSPAGATSARLASVTATSPSSAWAVGRADYPHHVTKLLIERWDGTNWTLVPVPNPAP